ncbi:Ig domain-containing protein [Vibrio sp. Sgm 22]|uniref:Ig domain-containing protein n=1 Tax=unclassified Vibrio TaxID=2614977 RepID=UPI002248FB24|nr:MULTISPECIES: Ig domain-containing protein [unclassified Vibrio]MCX2758116.1 Ig domain-containing protein [Vibrio sp. 14G-20]MCX2775524.1 Ig domain-containing protein [Vibrio sp. Sgm 22]
MKKVSLLAASVAFALTGCGGSDGDNSGATPGGVVITAIDGYLQHAEVWVDTDNDLLLDEAADTKLSELTNASGQYILPNEHKDNAIFIKAVANQTIDSTRGLVASDFVISATAGSTVINPMTNMVVEQLAGDDALTQEDAEAAVVASVTDSGLIASEDLIFGDYIADSTEEAKALNAIGETLVDNSGLTIEQQLELTEAVAVEAQAIIVDPLQEIDDFSPIVDVPTDGNPITVAPNSRPVDTENGVLENITLEPSDVWVELDASTFFQDAEGDTLTFELKELADDLNGLVINSNTGIISGDLTKPGTYDYQIFAKDEHGALSYPLSLKVIKLAENLAPEVVEEEQTRLQSVINGWQLQEGEVFNQTIDLSGLFNDSDGDIVKYRSGALTVDGLTITPTEDTSSIVTISGTPSKSYSAGQTFNVGGVDNDGAPTYVTFTLPEVLEGTPVEPPQPELGFTQAHFDKGGVWQMGSFDYGDAEVAFASLRINNDQNELCFATDDSSDFSTLSRQDWLSTLDNMQHNYWDLGRKSLLRDDDCFAVTLNNNGTVDLPSDAGTDTATMLYQNITKDGDYQIVMLIEESTGHKELFWMDSTEVEDGVNYNSFSYPSQNDMTVGVTLDEYLLVDDDGGYNDLYPLLDKFTYSMTGKNAENLAEGTYTATSITEPGESWSDNWLVGENVDNYDKTLINPYLGLVEDNDDCNCVVTRRYFTYRDFGELTIGVGDHNKNAQFGYGHDDNGFFFIKSNQEETIKHIHDAWNK